jgi:hypothetical protein
VERIGLTYEKESFLALVKAVLKLKIPYGAKHLLLSVEINSFSMTIPQI